ncbi:MAG: WD40 repeat domain-containing protein [Cyanobacteria bacterium P01_D01_bin.156]
MTVDTDALNVAEVEAVLQPIHPMLFSPNGQMIVIPQLAVLRKNDGRRVQGTLILLVSLESGEILHTLMVNETVLSTSTLIPPDDDPDVVFSPNGELLAASIPQDSSHVVYVWNAETGERRWRTRMNNCPELAFSKDGQFVLCTQRRIAIADGTVKSLEESALKPQSALVETILYPQLRQPQVISPDQSLKAIHRGNGPLEIFELVNGAEKSLALLRSDEDLAESAFFSPDSQQLIAVGYQQDAIYLWQRGSQTFEKISLSLDAVFSIIWSIDGKRIGLNSADNPNTFLIFEIDKMPRW